VVTPSQLQLEPFHAADMFSNGAVVATGHDLKLPSALHACANRIAVKVTDARDGRPFHQSVGIMAITLPLAIASLSSKKKKTMHNRHRAASWVFDPKSCYEVHSAERVIREKNACGVGMMANFKHEAVLMQRCVAKPSPWGATRATIVGPSRTTFCGMKSSNDSLQNQSLKGYESAGQMQKVWRESRRAQVASVVREHWANSIFRCHDSSGGRWHAATNCDMCCVSNDLHFWIAFISSGSSVAQATLAKIMFEKICFELQSYSLFSCAASSVHSVPLARQFKLPFSLPEDLQVAMAGPEFDVSKELTRNRFDLVVCIDEDARREVDKLEYPHPGALKVVTMFDFLDVCKSWPEFAVPQYNDISQESILGSTDFEACDDKMTRAVMMRALVGLEQFLVRRIPKGLLVEINPSLVPHSFTPQMRRVVENGN